MIEDLARQITELRGQGYSLRQIAESIRNARVHIENAKNAFIKAGFKAEVKRFKVLFIPIVELVIMDYSTINAMEDAMREFVDGPHDAAAIAKLEALIQSTLPANDKRDRTAAVDWSTGIR